MITCYGVLPCSAGKFGISPSLYTILYFDAVWLHYMHCCAKSYKNFSVVSIKTFLYCRFGIKLIIMISLKF